MILASDTGFILKEYAELNFNTRIVYGSLFYPKMLDDILYPGDANYKVTDRQAENIGIISAQERMMKYILLSSGISNPPETVPKVRRIRFAHLDTKEVEDPTAIGDILLKLRGFDCIVVSLAAMPAKSRPIFTQLVFDGMRKHGIFLAYSRLSNFYFDIKIMNMD